MTAPAVLLAESPVYIFGAGAVGMALAFCLAEEGRTVRLVRTHGAAAHMALTTVMLTLTDGLGGHRQTGVETIGLHRLQEVEGLLVITTKAHANAELSHHLAQKRLAAAAVILQNGLGVEAPFRALALDGLFRGVLYMTGERQNDHEVLFRLVSTCPVGVVQGDDAMLKSAVSSIATKAFPFHTVPDIRPQAWSKTILNAVFNSLCPLLEADNGLFLHNSEAAALARDIIRECLALARRYDLHLEETALMDRLFTISRESQGVFISTLQDLRHGRPTEMEALNLELARLASSLHPPQPLPLTETLGRLVKMKEGMYPPASPA